MQALSEQPSLHNEEGIGMEHHYILHAMIRLRDNEFLSPLGFVCKEDELTDHLKHAHVVKYKIKQVDDDPIQEWEKSVWTSIAY